MYNCLRNDHPFRLLKCVADFLLKEEGMGLREYGVQFANNRSSVSTLMPLVVP